MLHKQPQPAISHCKYDNQIPPGNFRTRIWTQPKTAHENQELIIPKQVSLVIKCYSLIYSELFMTYSKEITTETTVVVSSLGYSQSQQSTLPFFFFWLTYCSFTNISSIIDH